MFIFKRRYNAHRLLIAIALCCRWHYTCMHVRVYLLGVVFWCRPPMTCRAWLNFLLIRVPIIRWIIGYQPHFIVGDIISGITVAIMHIPQGKCSCNSDKYMYMYCPPWPQRNFKCFAYSWCVPAPHDSQLCQIVCQYIYMYSTAHRLLDKLKWVVIWLQ